MEPFAVALAVPISCLLALSCLPSRVANSHVKFVRQLVPALVALKCILAITLTCVYAADPEQSTVVVAE